MANEITVDRKLDDIFQDGYKLYKELETTSLPFNSSEFQGKVKKCTELFEDSTRLVSLIGMFSSNENVEEIATEHLKYLLLPFYLGQLSTKNSIHDREEVLKIANVYYKDFIKRCEDYEICQSSNSNGTQLVASSNQEDPSIQVLVQQANARNSKIEQYRQRKELEEQLNQMKEAIERDYVDDEVKRNFYMKMIKLSILNTKEELKSIEQELEILSFRNEHLKQQQQQQQSQKNNLGKEKFRSNSKVEPLKPIIITRDAAQKAVFGMGYPSLPVMTVNDFYEQRVREGIFPDAEKVEEMNRNMFQRQTSEEKEEHEKAEKDKLIDNDDPEYLERQRAQDEYKDVVRRGDGNRHNRS